MATPDPAGAWTILSGVAVFVYAVIKRDLGVHNRLAELGKEKEALKSEIKSFHDELRILRDLIERGSSVDEVHFEALATRIEGARKEAEAERRLLSQAMTDLRLRQERVSERLRMPEERDR